MPPPNRKSLPEVQIRAGWFGPPPDHPDHKARPLPEFPLLSVVAITDELVVLALMACTFVTGAVVPTPALPLLGNVFVCAGVDIPVILNQMIANAHLVAVRKM